MTVSLKIHVNGKYRATVNHATVRPDGGRAVSTPVVVGPQEEKAIYFQHGVVNELTVTEEYLGEDWTPGADVDPTKE